jgi:exopolysaccharide biosynthesis protein
VIQVNGSSAASTALKFKVGDLVTVSRAFQADSRSQFITAAGRGPRMVQGGKLIWICAQHNREHRPRSAIGWNQDGQVWLMTSSRGYDAFDFGYRQGGSTSSQMAQWLMSLGATDAVLLDGGGSTTMQINQPDVGWQRFDLPDNAWWRELANAFSIDRRG